MTRWPWTTPRRTARYAEDEFVGETAPREASPLDLKDRWQARLAEITRSPPGPSDLNLSAFSLLRGGDLFERTKKPARTPPELLETYLRERLRFESLEAVPEVLETARAGLLRVLAGNPAICRRMLLARPLRVVLIPPGHDFRSYGFPPSAHPNTIGLFVNQPREDHALIGLRQELVLEKAYVMVHEMTHAVHFLGLTAPERTLIDDFLRPVYRSRLWIDEAVAVHAERAFGAVYEPEDLAGSNLYAKTRREWSDRAVFSLFVEELLRPEPNARAR